MSFFGFGGGKKTPEPAAGSGSGSSPYSTYDEPSYDYSSPAPAASSFETGPSASPSTGAGYGANEVQALLLEEQQRALIQQAISKITAIAWDKCSAAKPDSDLSSKERECIKNTTLAYLDTSVFVMHRLNKSA